MSKAKTRYICSSCGATASGWMGKCPECNSWDTMTEEVISGKGEYGALKTKAGDRPIPTLLSEISMETDMRVQVGDPGRGARGRQINTAASNGC